MDIFVQWFCLSAQFYACLDKAKKNSLSKRNVFGQWLKSLKKGQNQLAKILVK